MKLIISLIVSGILLITTVASCWLFVNQKICVEKQKTAIKCLTDNQNILLQITRDGICQKLNDIEQKQIKEDKKIDALQVNLDKKIDELSQKHIISEKTMVDTLQTNGDILQINIYKKIEELHKKQLSDGKKIIDAMLTNIYIKIDQSNQNIQKQKIDKNIIPGGDVLISTNNLGILKFNVWGPPPSDTSTIAGKFTMNYFCNLVIDSISDGNYYFYTNGIISRINSSNVIHNTTLTILSP